MSATRSDRRKIWLVALTIGVFLVPAFLGFGNKFLEFLQLVRDEDGAFAVMPVLNYLLASLGFFLMLCWATAHGMFRDIEAPKHDMLATERQLDEEETAAQFWNHEEGYHGETR